MILVTAANGNQGRHLVPRLIAAGQKVRALVRTEESAQSLRQSGVADVVVGELSDPGILEKSVEGVRSVYHVGPTLHPREREIGLRVIDAAGRAGVEHFVFSSVLHSIASDLIQHEIKRDIEEHLLKSGLNYTVLQPSNYMLPLKLRSVFSNGIFQLSWDLGRRQSLVDLYDVAEVATKVLTEPAAHAAATYELAGTGTFTAHELAHILSGVVGHPVKAEQIDPDVYFKAWFGSDPPETRQHELRTLRAITAHYSAYDFIGNPNVLTWLLGRQPTGFEAFAKREYEKSRGPFGRR